MNMQKIHKNMNSLSDNELHIFAEKMTEPLENRTIREHICTFKGFCDNFAPIKNLVLN